MILLIGIVACLILYFRQRSQQKHQAQMARFEQDKEWKFYADKIDFFTNVAHKIRTPLTLIPPPLEDTLRQKTFEPDVKVDLQLLDFRKQKVVALN